MKDETHAVASFIPDPSSFILFFDAVGTLIYPSPPVGEVYADIGRRWGATITAAEIERRFLIAFQRQETWDREHGQRTDEERETRRWRTIVAEVFHDQPNPEGPFADLWSHFAQPDAWSCYPDVATCLAWLNDHLIGWGIASNYDSRLRSVVGGMLPLAACRYLAISSEIGWRKPARQFFEALVSIAGLSPSQVIHVGDDEANDQQGGEAAGLTTMLVQRHLNSPVSPERKQGISDLDELPARLQELGILA